MSNPYLGELFKVLNVLDRQYDLLGSLEEQRAKDPKLNAIIHEARHKNRQAYHGARGLYKQELWKTLAEHEKTITDNDIDLGGC